LLRAVIAPLVVAVTLGMAPAAGIRTAAAAEPAAGLQSSPWQTLHAGSRIRLVGVAGAAAGGINGGIEIELAEGWKTYWRMPGEAGVPPQFEWQGSDNLAGVQVSYPAPKRLPEPGAETIGYKSRVLFPFAAKAVTAGKPVTLKLEAEFGVCKEICVPAQANLTLALPSAARSVPLPPLLSDAVAQVPAAATGDAKGRPLLVATVARLDGATPELQVTARFAGPAETADVFIEAPDSIFVPMTKRGEVRPDGRITFLSRLTPDIAKDLKGKALTLTLVGSGGATEARWQLP
jgi:DsbC/DsbD-like thiol-disulfide interchange protein